MTNPQRPPAVVEALATAALAAPMPALGGATRL